ncbi:MAG: tyrosine-type recombinase/integrase [Hungatella hathewayi]|nr:tyrosine-type recombinase/integrase [Hungatella hathewayi]
MRMRKNMNPITKEVLEAYRGYLYDEERSRATVDKYLRDVRKFAAYLEEYGGGDERAVVNKDRVREYKQYLKENYKIASANSMLAAINSFFTYIGHEEWKVRLFKIQRAAYCQPETEMTRQDYRGLIRAAREAGDTRMSMLLQTVGSTGIRISELKYISVESLENGRAEIYNKGKSRVVLLPGKLVDMLRKYCRKKGIQSGSIFITRNGNPMDRSNISKRMKRLALEAGVDTAKVFPHNLRHLFARTFYSMEKDVVRLMDLLGHSNISTTRIYTAGTEEEPRHQLGRMNLILG